MGRRKLDSIHRQVRCRCRTALSSRYGSSFMVRKLVFHTEEISSLVCTFVGMLLTLNFRIKSFLLSSGIGITDLHVRSYSSRVSKSPGVSGCMQSQEHKGTPNHTTWPLPCPFGEIGGLSFGIWPSPDRPDTRLADLGTFGFVLRTACFTGFANEAFCIEEPSDLPFS